jgi:hypothetical protein
MIGEFLNSTKMPSYTRSYVFEIVPAVSKGICDHSLVIRILTMQVLEYNLRI